MEGVPITFEYSGKMYTGEFSTNTGSGVGLGDAWQLMIDCYYFGTFQYNNHAKDWVWSSPSGSFPGMGDYFQAYMIGWFQ